MAAASRPAESHPLFAAPAARVRALYLGRRIERDAFDRTALAQAPLVVEAAGGLAVLFRFGVVVLFGVDAIAEAALLRQLAPFVVAPHAEPVSEEAQLVVSAEGPERITPQGEVQLRELTLERLQVVADVLAKSAVLERYEEAVREAFDAVEPLAESLSRGAAGRLRGRELAAHIGRALRVQTHTVGRVEVGEKPEVLWDHPELERLHARLADEYELQERDAALERKLSLVNATAQTLLDLRNHDRSLRVEWYIVVLILVEIVLTLYELFLHGR